MLPKLQRVSSEDRKTPVCRQAVSQSAEIWSTLEFFATAQSCRECQFQSTVLSLAVWPELAQLHEGRLNSAHTGSMLTTSLWRKSPCEVAVSVIRRLQNTSSWTGSEAEFQRYGLRWSSSQQHSHAVSAHLRASTERCTKNSSCVELECGTTPPVRGDSARSHLMGSQLG